ncbi:MAG: hypothetical protein K0S71_1753 [Clostridia bacterium]|jgi:hypothetical protein|nr:hypothetical protein [Clostridia bacterium]
MRSVQKIFQPEIYQGRHKKQDYFEGWYFKQVSADQKHTIALIPGVSLNHKDSHAFVQVIIAENNVEDMDQKSTLVTHYYRFPLSDFSFQDEPFSIQIGKNIFSKTDIFLDLQHDHLRIEGHLYWNDIQPIQKSLLCPNIMGFFGYFSFMECYHGIISMKHVCSGKLCINGKEIVYSGGQGYIEKDWGHSFPKEYIWVQCNHFTEKGTAMMFSVAHIPFLGNSFKGFLCNLSLQGKEYRWATYNHSKIIKEVVSENKLFYLIKRKQLMLEIEAEVRDHGVLIAPQNGQMIYNIKEGLMGTVKMKLMNKDGDILYEDIGTSAGVEIVAKKYS